MKARWAGAAIGGGEKSAREILMQPGDIGLGAENYHYNLLVNCPICRELHVVDIEGGVGPSGGPGRWSWDGLALTAAPSYKLTHHTGEICHWTLTNGEFTIHPDSTAKPR